MQFKQWLLNELNLNSNKWITPDDLYGGGEKEIAFIYTEEKELFAVPDETHGGIVKATPELMEKYKTTSRYAIIESFPDLLGRISIGYQFWDDKKDDLSDEKHNIISFWNRVWPSAFLAQSCLGELKKRKLINDSFIVSTPFGTQPIVANNQAVVQKPAMSNQEISDLQKKLHVMNPMDKKNAMRQLGMVRPMKKNPWQGALEKVGSIQPGQKWQTPTSENLHNKNLSN